MYIKEKVQPNKVNAPVLFIGVGGIGSKIIKGVADRCLKDDTSNIRFVVMDTDVNDLLNVNKGATITAVQTSSTSTVEDYLKNDADAKNGWFPENKMLDPKAVSEGAGQVRAISRLALNATIKQGNIHKLYKAIDDLFLKDGGGLKQAIRVVIASTAAGGTGSGIAMEAGMLVRHYIKKNYPEAAVMIRGFLVMPGVMDTVIKTQSEKDSLRCNGYSTIKEINAFMMKGSGFFDTVPELHRYKDLHMMIPSTSDGDEKLSNLPFDFCFLLDRTDSNAGNMTTLGQYINYASQSIYEQNIGPMRSKASSMEDNVLKLCISPEKLGRCRFGGTGASVLKYPYEDVRDYLALNWTRSAIIGSSSDDSLTEAERKALLKNSWLQFDAKFAEERKKWEDNPNRSAKNEPTVAGVYTSSMEGGKESSAGNEFTSMLWDRYITPKVDAMPDNVKTTERLAKYYIRLIVEETIKHRLTADFPEMEEAISTAKTPIAERGSVESKYRSINQLENMSRDEVVPTITKNFANELFNSKAPIEKEDLGEYMLEKYLSLNGKAIHPNAARHLLYELKKAMTDELEEAKRNSDETAFNESVADACFGQIIDKGKRDTSVFDIQGSLIAKEKNLLTMCQACDDKGNAKDIESCEEKLTGYFETVEKFYTSVIKRQICEVGIPAVERLIKAYENFYMTFESKVPSIERKKEDITTKLKFHNGDCIKYVVGEKKYLDKLTAIVGLPTESGEGASKLYAKIFESVRENAYIEQRKSVNPFGYEAKKDIFDDIIIEYYKDKVTESCELINVKGILQAIKLEYDIKSAIELDEVSEELKDSKALEIHNDSNLSKYIATAISVCNNLASPGIKKKDNDEPREVSAIACNDGIADGEGIRVNDFLSEAIRTDTVSKYELHFFRSVYNIMPTQLAKLSAPAYDDATDEFSISGENEYEQLSAGDYFCIYQKYMDKMGPDCKTSAIITPHVDMRWNSIVVLPELDLEYQKKLMRKIHKAMIYGFIYDRIHLFSTMDNDNAKKVYKYLNNDNDPFDMMVSNKTKCDVLYEVLDALYNDRLAVSIIKDYVNKIRDKSKSAGFQSHEDLEFFKKLKTFKFKHFTNEETLRSIDDRVSLFTVVLMYCNSLPAQNKDMAEMKTMVESIIEMVYSEMNLCTSNKDSLNGKVADILIDQFNRLVENYKAHAAELKRGNFSEQVISSIQRTLWSFMDKRDLESYKDKMVAFEEN